MIARAPNVTPASKQAHTDASRARRESHRRLKEALARAKAAPLTESAGGSVLAEAIVSEAIVLERAQLLEAAGADVTEQTESYRTMLVELEDLAHNLRSGTLARAVDKLSAAQPADADVLAGDPRSVKKFQRALADAAVLTKGMLALARAIDDDSSGTGQTFHQAMERVQPTDRLDFALSGLGAPGGEQKRSFLQKLTRTGGAPKERFSRELKGVLSAAAGLDRQLDVAGFLRDVMFSPVGRLLGSLRNFDAAVSERVSPEMLVQMSKTSLVGAIKSMFDIGGGSSGGAGSRLGASRALSHRLPPPAPAGLSEGPSRALFFFSTGRCNLSPGGVEWFHPRRNPPASPNLVRESDPTMSDSTTPAQSSAAARLEELKKRAADRISGKAPGSAPSQPAASSPEAAQARAAKTEQEMETKRREAAERAERRKEEQEQKRARKENHRLQIQAKRDEAARKRMPPLSNAAKGVLELVLGVDSLTPADLADLGRTLTITADTRARAVKAPTQIELAMKVRIRKAQHPRYAGQVGIVTHVGRNRARVSVPGHEVEAYAYTIDLVPVGDEAEAEPTSASIAETESKPAAAFTEENILDMPDEETAEGDTADKGEG